MKRRAALLLTFAASVLATAPAQAETFTVNTELDGPASAACTAVACTLRSAFNAATTNAPGTQDLVEIPAGTYAFNPQFGPGVAVPTNETGLQIRGAGANQTFIQPQAGATNVRLFAVNGGGQVTFSDLTLRGGNMASNPGGNLYLLGNTDVALQRVRVTGGSAPQGGGIAVQAGSSGATLTVSESLIDANTATGTALTAAGGGLYIEGSTGANAVTIQDSTITANSARNGAGIAVTNNAGQPPILRGVTLAGNTARAGTPTGVGGISSASATVRFQGSIVAGNTTTINLGPGPVQAPANCSITPAATDDGGNVETATDCGLAGHQNTDPQLAAALDSSQPPVLAIPANSPAVDVADCAGRTVDQRGVARPQGSACDAGAYEYQAPPPVVTPTATPTATATPVTTAVPTAPPTAAPRPVRNQSVGARPVRGRVLIKQRGASKFVALDPSVIRNGSEVDTRKGRVEITTSTNEKAVFYDGIFKVSQSGGITTLTLSEKLTGCPKARKSSASAAAKKPKTRKLWGDGKGKFRTKGQYSAATIRGTKWLVQDTCTTTRTTVKQGVVEVRDAVKHKKIVLRKNKTYIVRARR